MRPWYAGGRGSAGSGEAVTRTALHAVRKALVFDRRPGFAGYGQAVLVRAKTPSVVAVATTVALRTEPAVLFFRRPSAGGRFAVPTGSTVIALTGLGLLWAAGLGGRVQRGGGDGVLDQDPRREPGVTTARS